jgi:TonB family protein
MKNLLHYLLIGVLASYSLTLSAQGADNPDNKPMVSVEKMPQYPGGDEALLNFIKENLKYPSAAVSGGVEGRVTVRFVVGEDGYVRDIVVVRSLNSACDDEAVRVVKLMPRWTPGEVSGRKVPVYYTLPVAYRIPKADPLLFVDGFSQPYSLLKDTTKLKPANIKSMNVLKEAIAIERFGEKGMNGVVIVETVSRAAKIDSALRFDVPLYSVEVMPQFPGGDRALVEFIQNNLKYPRADAELGIQGRTTIRFIINKQGKPTDITVIRGLSQGCDAEAVRVVQMMPTWKPGTQNGQPVCVYYTLPMVFKLQR